MNLIITKCLDRLKLVTFIRHKLTRYTILPKEAFYIADHLPYIKECLWRDEADHLANELNGIAEFTIELTQEEINHKLQEDFLNKKYTEAQEFYDSLSKEDQEKIDLLIQRNQPIG